MGTYKMFRDSFSNERRLAWIRSKAQAEFRGEVWNISWEEFCHFWKTPSLWSRRGRHINNLVLTRYNVEAPWDKDNCCIITRDCHLKAKINRKLGRDFDEYFTEAIWYDGRR